MERDALYQRSQLATVVEENGYSSLSSTVESSDTIVETSTTKVEIFEYPHDCVAGELSYHFSREPYRAESTTPLREMWCPRSSTFILDFTREEAGRIVKNSVQRLDSDDPKSEIRVGLLEALRSAQVLITCQHEMNYRMVTQFFKSYGEVEKFQQSYGMMGDYRVILTFKDPTVAETVCSVGYFKIGPVVCVRAQLFKDVTEPVHVESASPTGTSLSLNFDLDSVSCVGGVISEARSRNLLISDTESFTREEFHHSSLPFSVKEQAAPMSSDTSSEISNLELGPSSAETTDHNIYESIELNTEPPKISSTSSTDSHIYSSVHPVAAATTPACSAALLTPLPVPTINLHCCIQVNNCIIRLVEGSIVEHAADVIVHSRGNVERMLARRCRTNMDLIEVINGQPYGDIHVTSAPNLAARYLFGFRLVDGDGGVSKKHFVGLCLQHCDKLRMRSVAFPALGTGDYGSSPKFMSSLLVELLVNHMKNSSRSSLEIIDIVIFQRHMINEYSTALKQATSSSRTNNFSKLRTKNRSKVENVYQVSNKSHKIQFTK